jgi:hypothetical protein
MERLEHRSPISRKSAQKHRLRKKTELEELGQKHRTRRAHPDPRAGAGGCARADQPDERVLPELQEERVDNVRFPSLIEDENTL